VPKSPPGKERKGRSTFGSEDLLGSKRYNAWPMSAESNDNNARQEPEQPITSYLSKENVAGVSVSAFLAIAGVVSLWCRLNFCVSFVAIILTDVYLLYLIAIVGLHADKCANTYDQLPHRIPALMMISLLFIGMLHAFGNLYLNSDVVCPSRAECTSNGTSHIMHADDALYFSAVTMATVGYGDFYPGDRATRRIVIWQLGNSVTLVILLFPLVMSRFATF
jgi:Ion channel